MPPSQQQTYQPASAHRNYRQHSHQKHGSVAHQRVLTAEAGAGRAVRDASLERLQRERLQFEVEDKELRLLGGLNRWKGRWGRAS